MRKYMFDDETCNVSSICYNQVCRGYFHSRKTTKKCCNMNFIGQVYSKILTNFARAVHSVNNWIGSLGET